MKQSSESCNFDRFCSKFIERMQINVSNQLKSKVRPVINICSECRMKPSSCSLSRIDVRDTKESVCQIIHGGFLFREYWRKGYFLYSLGNCRREKSKYLQVTHQ